MLQPFPVGLEEKESPKSSILLRRRGAYLFAAQKDKGDFLQKGKKDSISSFAISTWEGENKRKKHYHRQLMQKRMSLGVEKRVKL